MKRLVYTFVFVFFVMLGCANAPGRTKKEYCATRYPIFLVHGVAYRDDVSFLGYWGRIPDYLEKRGTTVYYSSQDAWNTHDVNAKKLKTRINEILAETGARKVNIIAHSKGGIESRYMITKLGMADKVATLTTMSTPHHGSAVADAFFKHIPENQQQLVDKALNLAGFIVGDKSPKAREAGYQMTTKYMSEFNEHVTNMPGVYYQSYAFVIKYAMVEPVFAVSSTIISFMEGGNDGMVSTNSAKWGTFRKVFGEDTRGLSHLDAIDAKRNRVHGVNVPDLYVDVVHDLKMMGY